MKLLYKELKLAASPLSYFFLAGALLAFVPGYPILLGAFFVTLGIFYSFQAMRENNDIGYSLLLPVAKADVVKGKFLFTCFVELCGFLLMAAVTLVRMSFLSEAPAYTSNALMGANLVFLGEALVIFGLFNFVFVRGFWRTAYYFGKPFLIYCALAILAVCLAETLPHLPGLAALNTLGFSEMGLQLAALGAGALLFALLTLTALRSSIRRFEKIDL